MVISRESAVDRGTARTSVMRSQVITLIVTAAAAVGLVNGDLFYSRPPPLGYYNVGGPSRFYPQVYGLYGGGLEEETGLRSGSGYEGGDSLRKSVHDVQESGLESSRGEGGRHAVQADTRGSEGFEETAAAQDSRGYGARASGGLKEAELSTKGGYGGFGSTAYKKGHSNKGFHKSYNNVETGKDSSFVDEHFTEGGEGYGKSLDDGYLEADSESWTKGGSGSGGSRQAGGSAVAQSGLTSSGEHQLTQGAAGRQGKFHRGQLLEGETAAGASRIGASGRVYNDIGLARRPIPYY